MDLEHISPDWSDQQQEGTCYANSIARLFINNVIKVVHPTLVGNMERDCNFELSTQTGPNWDAISEHTCSKRGYAKLLLFFYIYYFAYSQYTFEGATTTEVSKLVNDIFHILKSGQYVPSPKIPEKHQAELKKILARLKPKMTHVSHIDFMHIHKINFKLMDTSNERTYHLTVLENMKQKNKRWKKLIKPEPNANIQFFFNCLRNLLKNHIYVILSPEQHAMVLVGYKKHNFYIKDSAQQEHRFLKSIKYPLRPQHDPYITRSDAYISEHIPNYWLIWPRFNVANKPDKLTRLKMWYTGNYIVSITNLNDLYSYTSLVIKEINEHRLISESQTKRVTSVLSVAKQTSKRTSNIANYWNKTHKSQIPEGTFTPSMPRPSPLKRTLKHAVNKNYAHYLSQINENHSAMPPPLTRNVMAPLTRNVMSPLTRNVMSPPTMTPSSATRLSTNSQTNSQIYNPLIVTPSMPPPLTRNVMSPPTMTPSRATRLSTNSQTNSHIYNPLIVTPSMPPPLVRKIYR